MLEQPSPRSKLSTLRSLFGSRALPTSPLPLVPPEAPSQCWQRCATSTQRRSPHTSVCLHHRNHLQFRYPWPSGGAEWSTRWKWRPVTQVLQPFPSLVDLGSMVCFVMPPLWSPHAVRPARSLLALVDLEEVADLLQPGALTTAMAQDADRRDNDKTTPQLAQHSSVLFNIFVFLF
jgi:hypothetical protein